MSIHTKVREVSPTQADVHILDTDAIPRFLRDTGITITHDERGAPIATREDGTEDAHVLLSITDEDEFALCGWAQKDEKSPFVGLGIDLVNLGDFAGERGRDLERVLLTERDRQIVDAAWPDEPKLGWAYAFSAKEAAFKSLAAPLRRWYETHDGELAFDVRGFELADVCHAQGSARHGDAQRAMDAMGIERIELSYELRGRYLLTWALAFK